MGKRLVAYFSASGRTRKVAENFARIAEADIYEIVPEKPYTRAELDWRNPDSRSSIEMHNLSIRPEMADKSADIKEYDTIFLGFPIWWHMAPTIVNTFLESYDFSGKNIVLFATSGGSGMDNSMNNLKVSVSEATSFKGERLLRGYEREEELRQWIESLDV